MVSCKLYGRLGNQMFQLATAMATAKKWDVPFYMPEKTLNEDAWPNYFNNIIPLSEFKAFDWSEYKELSHGYADIPNKGENVILNGYFQSYKYFDFYISELRKIFGFDGLPKAHGYCSIHVRRGDYLIHPTKHPVASPRYFLMAIEEMINATGIYNFMVCSDDVFWCKEFFDGVERSVNRCFPKGGIKFTYSTNRSALEDMKVMSCSEHNIISNSTFSWWSAYLNKNPNKVIITPDEHNWFGVANRHLDVSDLIPGSWVRIKY